MRVYILGSCSGTEPMPGRHHTSIAIDVGGRLFWFDAGEGCSYTAHLGGLDLAATEAIFISHTHMDHVGGLPNLLWTMRKLTGVRAEAREKLEGKDIGLFIPNLEVFEAMQVILSNTEGRFSSVFSLAPEACREGRLYDRDGVRVEALRNGHGGEGFRSYSFRLEAEGKIVVFSGDVKGIEDLDAWTGSGCDLLMMETGHHRAEDVCRHLGENGRRVGRLLFVHHGRAILADAEGERQKARALLGDRVEIAEDGQCIEM